ncbi:hypothetical protein A3F58_01765 [Candidatus Roizmanbacteria bacterium RIFCSPHIGHO2_12_FULL_37_9b]|uniref:O-antigen ligase-related domain-containing protein n=1 Tax=Candidatus Roizmanbacteria bacterium RIFCSPHIGHO2_02_FULL_38_11 TaxID=1802039 RepID=A0A1F7H2Z4_9BACT|nr:MAG: hypothetical protein A3C25_01310 [Candidatus Roizmanbacteria bacterium RIFCSPHIGHO2_02_FULL_38_11]OGK34616.1 MAG: hypothetical protein A3F58_01765 [Candidatus Roizmanbacteria bacterium RIFCSPHIGHO2_12_FULL_37_9b]
MLLSLLFYLTFFLFSLGQLGRISFFGQQINVYIYEIFLLIFTLVLFYKYRFKPLEDSIRKFKITYLFLGFLAVTFLTNLSGFKLLENSISFLYFLRLLHYFMYFFYLSYHLRKHPQFERTLTKAIVIGVVLTATISILQYFWYQDLRNLLYGAWDPHLYRLFGTFFDTSIAGAIYGLIFLTLFLKGKEFIKNKWLLLGFLASYFIFIILTYSRSLYTAFLFIIILHTAAKRKYKGFLIFFTVFLLAVLFAPKPFGEGVNLERTFSVESRVNDYKTAIKMWQKKPLLGVGYNRIRYVKRQMNVIGEAEADITHSGASFHSSFLIILVSGGFVGLGLFMGVLYRIFQVSMLGKYYVVFLGLLSLTDNIILHPFILFMLFSLCLLDRFIPFRRLR